MNQNYNIEQYCSESTNLECLNVEDTNFNIDEINDNSMNYDCLDKVHQIDMSMFV